MKPKLRIIKTRCGKFFIQKKWLCFWMIHHPIKSPTFMDTLYQAELEIRKIKKYQNSKQHIIWEE
jgi:hypothetical protein